MQDKTPSGGGAATEAAGNDIGATVYTLGPRFHLDVSIFQLVLFSMFSSQRGLTNRNKHRCDKLY